MSPTCLVCRGSDVHPLYPDLDVVRCGACGFVFATTEIDPRAIYTAEYFTGSVYEDYRRERTAHHANFERRLRLLKRHGPQAKSLLEIGCAYGYFLELAQEHYAARGIDISIDAVRVARDETGVRAVAADFLDLPDPPVPEVDIICMWDVIEHLRHPDRYLAKSRAWLRTGGLVALTTGDISSLNARWRGSRWRLMCPPHHLAYFSPHTLRRLLGRLGFELVHLGHEGVSRSYRSTVEALVGSKGLACLLTLGRRLDFTYTVNLRDIVLVVARKN